MYLDWRTQWKIYLASVRILKKWKPIEIRFTYTYIGMRKTTDDHTKSPTQKSLMNGKKLAWRKYCSVLNSSCPLIWWSNKVSWFYVFMVCSLIGKSHGFSFFLVWPPAFSSILLIMPKNLNTRTECVLYSFIRRALRTVVNKNLN